MSKVRVAAYSISIDGYGAGPHQSLENPLGVGGPALHGWAAATKTFRSKVFEMTDGSGTTGVDEDFAARSFEDVGAWIMGRNMFAPSRGPWPANDEWKGWWGPNPSYHCPVFVLTHHERPPLVMEGGTTFHFVTDGIHAALERAQKAANGKDIRIGGGAATIRAYLSARLIDEMHFAISPAILGSGEHLLSGIDLPALGYELREHVTTPTAMHLVVVKKR